MPFLSIWLEGWACVSPRHDCGVHGQLDAASAKASCIIHNRAGRGRQKHASLNAWLPQFARVRKGGGTAAGEVARGKLMDPMP